MAQHVVAGEGSSGDGCSPVPVPCLASPMPASPLDPVGPVPPPKRTIAAYHHLMVKLTAKIGSLSQANGIIKKLAEDNENVKKKYLHRLEEYLKAFRERIHRGCYNGGRNEAEKAYKELNSCRLVVEAAEKFIHQETLIIEGVKKDDEEVKARMKKSLAISKTDSQ